MVQHVTNMTVHGLHQVSKCQGTCFIHGITDNVSAAVYLDVAWKQPHTYEVSLHAVRSRNASKSQCTQNALKIQSV